MSLRTTIALLVGSWTLQAGCGTPGGATSASGTSTGITSLELTSSSGEGMTTAEVPTTSVTGAGSTGGSASGTGTTSGEPTGGSTGVTTVVETTGTTTDATGSGTEPPPPCQQGDIVCDGGEAKVCDGMGGWESSEPCAGFCMDGVGCLAC